MNDNCLDLKFRPFLLVFGMVARRRATDDLDMSTTWQSRDRSDYLVLYRQIAT